MFFLLLCNNISDVFCSISANTPDVVVVNEGSGEVLILEVGYAFDHSLHEQAAKIPALKHTIS